MDGNRRVYLLHPNASQIPGIDEWIDEVRDLIGEDADWQGWSIDATPLDDRGRIEVQPYWVRVRNRPGPVVVVDPHQRRVFDDLAERLGLDAVVMTGVVGDSTDLLGVVGEAKRLCVAGEPFRPRRLIVAVLIVRKLRRYHYWSGNSKGYLWASDLSKGRGVDEKYSDIALEVADYLLTHGILVTKTSKGQPKLALNPERKPEVHAIADSAEFWNDSLRQVLYRNAEMEPAVALAVSNVAQRITLQLDGRPLLNLPSISAALSEARNLPDGSAARAVAEVHYDDGHCVREELADRGCLLRFLEALAS